MSGLELNKIIAAILLSSLIAMLVGFVANILYKPKIEIVPRGYHVLGDGDNTAVQASTDDSDEVNIGQIMAKANAELGANVAKKCVSCHTFEQGGAHKVGPNLWQVVGSNKGGKADFAYSKAMLSAGGAWDEESLYHFLHKPGKYINGTKMSFAGLSKPEDIANVVAYLKAQSGNQ